MRWSTERIGPCLGYSLRADVVETEPTRAERASGQLLSLRGGRGLQLTPSARRVVGLGIEPISIVLQHRSVGAATMIGAQRMPGRARDSWIRLGCVVMLPRAPITQTPRRTGPGDSAWTTHSANSTCFESENDSDYTTQ